MSRYGHPHGVGRLAAEHHLELGEAEVERVVAVEQRDADRVRNRLREPRRQLEPGEAGAEDQDVSSSSAPILRAPTSGLENFSNPKPQQASAPAGFELWARPFSRRTACGHDGGGSRAAASSPASHRRYRPELQPRRSDR